MPSCDRRCGGPPARLKEIYEEGSYGPLVCTPPMVLAGLPCCTVTPPMVLGSVVGMAVGGAIGEPAQSLGRTDELETMPPVAAFCGIEA